MKINHDIQQDVAAHVRMYLSEKLPSSFRYHNLQHTESTVDAIKEISDGMRLSDEQRSILIVAAWFHDAGYVCRIEGHEEVGARMAEQFLKDRKVDAEEINLVKSSILATRYPQRPKSLLEKVICDADMWHIARKDFFEKSTLLREEWRLTRNLNYTDEQWNSMNLQFLSNHVFHTAYCTTHYDKRRKKNISFLTRLIRKSNKESTLLVEPEINPSAKEVKMGRGVETFFRITSRNHMELSGMADSKAHILLTINSILISIVISFLPKRLEQSSYLIWPTALLLLVSLVTIVFAVLSTKPKVQKGVFTRHQVAQREANLMFFGNFHNMDLGTYDWGVREIIKDQDYLYSSMTRDVHSLGKVLAVKYHYLNIGYKVFMYGLIASVVAYGISFASMKYWAAL